MVSRGEEEGRGERVQPSRGAGEKAGVSTHERLMDRVVTWH